MANKERLNLLIELAKHVAALIARAISGTAVTNEELTEAKAKANTWRKKLLSLTKTTAVDPTPAVRALLDELDDDGGPKSPAEQLQHSGHVGDPELYAERDEPIAADLEPRPSIEQRVAKAYGPPPNSLPVMSADELAAHQAVVAGSPMPAPSQKTKETLTGIVKVGTVDPTPEGDYLPTPAAEVVFETPDPLDAYTSEDERANDEGKAPQEVK